MVSLLKARIDYSDVLKLAHIKEKIRGYTGVSFFRSSLSVHVTLLDTCHFTLLSEVSMAWLLMENLSKIWSNVCECVRPCISPHRKPAIIPIDLQSGDWNHRVEAGITGSKCFLDHLLHNRPWQSTCADEQPLANEGLIFWQSFCLPGLGELDFFKLLNLLG